MQLQQIIRSSAQRIHNNPLQLIQGKILYLNN